MFQYNTLLKAFTLNYSQTKHRSILSQTFRNNKHNTSINYNTIKTITRSNSTNIQPPNNTKYSTPQYYKH